MTERKGFQHGKGEPAKKGPPTERKVTSGKKGSGKTEEAKKKNPVARTTNPRSKL